VTREQYNRLEPDVRMSFLRRQRFDLRQKLAHITKVRQRRHDRPTLYVFGGIMLWAVLVGIALMLAGAFGEEGAATILGLLSGLALQNSAPSELSLIIAVSLLYGFVLLMVYLAGMWRYAHFSFKLAHVEDRITYFNETPEDAAIRIAERKRHHQFRRFER